MKTIAETLAVARSNLVVQAATETTGARRGRRPAPEDELLAEIKATSASASWRHASTRKAPEPIAGSSTFSSRICSGVARGPRRSRAGRNVSATIGWVSERGV